MRSKPMILVALLFAAFLVNLDTTLVNVALPAMVRELHATTTQLQWVVDAYNLVFAALLLNRPQPPVPPPAQHPAARRARQLPARQLPFDLIPVTVYREHDASKRH